MIGSVYFSTKDDVDTGGNSKTQKPDMRHRRRTHLVVGNGHVHLPGQVVREIERVRRVTHGDLVKPSVAQSDGGLGSHDLERYVLRLVGEQSVGFTLGARNVFNALLHVGGGGVLQDKEA